MGSLSFSSKIWFGIELVLNSLCAKCFVVWGFWFNINVLILKHHLSSVSFSSLTNVEHSYVL